MTCQLIYKYACDHVGITDIPHVKDLHKLQTPETYDTVSGTATATQEGTITYGGITVKNSKILPSSKESLVSLQTLSDMGCTYVHSKRGAVLVHDDNGKCVE